MYTPNIPNKTDFNINTSEPGEPIEMKIARMMNNNEAITEISPIIYTERKDGVNPLYNIRTDRFELALEDTTQITQMALDKRKEFHKKLEEENKTKTDAAE